MRAAPVRTASSSGRSENSRQAWLSILKRARLRTTVGSLAATDGADTGSRAGAVFDGALVNFVLSLGLAVALEFDGFDFFAVATVDFESDFRADPSAEEAGLAGDPESE